MAFPEAARKVPLAWLSGLKDHLEFYIPAAFLLDSLARDRNWDGRPAGTGRIARKVLELSLVLILTFTMDTDCNVPYVRTLCVAPLLWMPWNDAVPGCVESSLIGSGCRAYPRMKTFDQT